MKLVIFDMDGVLTESSRQHFEAWRALARELGIEIDLEFNEKLKGVSRIESLERILEHGGKRELYTGEEINTLANKKNEHYKELITHFTRDNLFEGVIKHFNYLKNNGIKIAIGSASKNAPFLLKAMEIDSFVDYIVNPAEIKNGKPAPDIFLKAAEALGIAPSECIGVEDAEAGVEAIKAAGMFAIGVGREEDLPLADVVYEHTKDIDFSKYV